jgi:branched-subunit amino acid transport protein
MNEFLLIFGMALVTFAVRYPVLAIFGRLNLPESVMRALRYVPVAVLTAIIVPGMVLPGGSVDLSLNNAYLVAGVVSMGIAWYTRKLLPTIALGMVFFLLWRALF